VADDEALDRRARADVRDYLRQQEAAYTTLHARLVRSLGEPGASRVLAEVMAERWPLRWVVGMTPSASTTTTQE